VSGPLASSAACALLLFAAFGCAGRRADGELARGTLSAEGGRAWPTLSGLLTVQPSAVQLWYERAGAADAPAVVLINGNDSQAVYWPDAFVAALLGRGYQVVRFDGRDAGLSEWLAFPEGFDPEGWTPEQPPPYPLEAHATDLLGLLDGLGL
jgi:hypothetical protein